MIYRYDVDVHSTREPWSARAQPDFRGHGPKGYRRSDERIAEVIHERLTEDPWLDAVDIEFTVKDGEVTLSGTVSDRQARRRAEDLVESIGGVGYVQNNLRLDRGEQPTAAANEKTISELSMRNPVVRPTPSVAAQIGGLGIP